MLLPMANVLFCCVFFFIFCRTRSLTPYTDYTRLAMNEYFDESNRNKISVCRPRRKFQISVEALFMIDFPTLKHKFSFFLDRKQTRLTLDIASHSITHSKHFEIPGMNETSTIRSLALVFHENTMTLFIDCKESSKLEIDIGMNKLYLQMDEPVIKLFRERKYPLHFDTSIDGAFGRANCQKGMHRRGSKRQLRNKQSDRGKLLMSCYTHIHNILWPGHRNEKSRSQEDGNRECD